MRPSSISDSINWDVDKLFLDGKHSTESNAGIASKAITGNNILRFKSFPVKRTIIWNRKHVIDPNCLFTEKDYDLPLNYLEQTT